MRALLVCLCLCVPLLGLADWSGEVGLRAEWRFPGSLTLAGRVGLDYVQEAFSFGASGEIPFTSPSSWRASLRMGLSLDPLRLRTQLRLARTGLDYAEGSISFSPGPWEVLEGDLWLRADLRVSLRDPLGSATVSVSGNASVRHAIGDFWWEVSGGFALYPPPPSVGGKTVSLGYRSGEWWISVRNTFGASWERTALELGYAGDPVRVTARGEFTPAGFSRASLSLSLDLGAARANVRFGLAPTGPTDVNVSLNYRGEGWGLSLAVTFAIPLRPDAARLEVTYRF